MGWLDNWRRTARNRGFRQDIGGWLTPGGQRVPSEFVQRTCSTLTNQAAADAIRALATDPAPPA